MFATYASSPTSLFVPCCMPFGVPTMTAAWIYWTHPAGRMKHTLELPRRQHRQQNRKSSDDDPEGEPEPSGFPSLATWSPDQLEDVEQWDAGEYDARARDLDSLHQAPAPLPEIENRPAPDVIELWNHAKAHAAELSDQFRALQSGPASAIAFKMAGCQSHFWIAPADQGWTISNVRRCNYRLCPVDSLARARRLRPQIDQIAPRLQDAGKLTFCTFKATGQPPAQSSTYCDLLPHPVKALQKAWRAMSKKRPFCRAVQGAFVGVHISRGLYPHLHAVLLGDAPRSP